jgi:hypothetical protein
VGGGKIALVVALVVVAAPACQPRMEGGTTVLIPRYPSAAKAYHGETLARSEVAIVETAAGRSPGHASAFIRTVDGEYLRGAFDGTVQVQVPPGSHSFGLGFGPNGLILGAKTFPSHATVTFTAAAGHTYRIYGHRQRIKGSPSAGRTVVYVLDVTTGQRVVG